ncbi:MAG: toxin-activating lysine-acyltransferase [Alphaproteobacteria bacterium]|nr:toxin-activating lysine-acyltransferase [Alphaproteobacteria bacterium]
MFFGKKKKEEPKSVEAAAAPPPAAAPDTAPEADSQVSAATGGRHPHHVLGQIANLMASSPNFQQAKLADLSWLAIPAIKANQVAVAEAKDKAGNLLPVGAVLWARVSPEVDSRLTSQASYPPQIKAQEWTSGDIPWIVLAVGSEKACQATIAQISKSQLGGRTMKLCMRDANGNISVRELSAAA